MYKKLIEGKKAVFFDLDGTVVNTTGLWAEAIRNILTELGNSWISDTNAYTPGESLNTQWKNLIQKYRIKTGTPVQELIQKTHNEYIKLLGTVTTLEAKEGFWDLLYELKEEKKLKTVLTTNSLKAVGYETLKKIGAENSFDLVIYGDDVKNPKPDPEIYNLAINRAGLSTQEVLVFEDSPTGFQASISAGLDTAVILDGTFLKDEYKGPVRMFLPNFSLLPQHLDKTFEEWMDHEIGIAEKREEILKNTRASDIS